MAYGIHIPTRVRFGEGVTRELPDVLREMSASRVIVVTDPGLKEAGVARQVEALAREACDDVRVYADVEPDPSVDTVHQIASFCREGGADVLVAVGGGSAMDVAKGARIVAELGGDIRRFAGTHADPIPGPLRMRLCAIPTTAGTGSEVTFFGVYSDWEHQVKVTVTSPHLAADVALVDPLLTHSVPPKVTAASGIDVLAHALEAYVSRQATPFSDALAQRAMELVGSSLVRAVEDGRDASARRDMAEASLFSGIAFNHAYLGLTHAIAAAVSGHAHVPHGVAIGICLPAVIRYNAHVCADKYRRAADILARGRGLGAGDAAGIVEQLARNIGLPSRLRDVGVTKDMLAGIARQTLVSVQLRHNPREASEQDVLSLVESLW
ncbi:iron-containing alcohol dehydrogenase family protein [Alicyclobacillus acidocaldarius]|uniref:Alcohol dehydrogenase n=1 Tax=Alicyclobacillus acidocaldarius (strain Tc-4-1) TaxID=1048834 RepID=F8IEN0_ALIAT|nr:iron-containing alcohol dehydrogenase [Alicyclobacillus acidocaldarius]AEJ42744.1 alcohol dehydrogenase [Alicyclobacillus acidocaldarius subsp. acidocaldarius Tc-4-1]